MKTAHLKYSPRFDPQYAPRTLHVYVIEKLEGAFLFPISDSSALRVKMEATESDLDWALKRDWRLIIT